MNVQAKSDARKKLYFCIICREKFLNDLIQCFRPLSFTFQGRDFRLVRFIFTFDTHEDTKIITEKYSSLSIFKQISIHLNESDALGCTIFQTFAFFFCCTRYAVNMQILFQTYFINQISKNRASKLMII